MMSLTVTCPYCGRHAALVDGTVVYPHRGDLAAKQFYLCVPCGAYVGCHPGTITPLGRLANAELRLAKLQAHAAFDPLWLSGAMRRRAAYRWLAEQIGLDAGACHIGMFDVAQCRRVVEVVRGREVAAEVPSC